MPEHHVGLDSPRLPQPGQAHLDGEQRRLSERGVPQRFSSLTAGFTVSSEEHFQQRPRQYRADRVGAACHSVRENRLSVEQLARHP